MSEREVEIARVDQYVAPWACLACRANEVSLDYAEFGAPCGKHTPAAVLRAASIRMKVRAERAEAQSSAEWWAKGIWFHHYPILDGAPGETDAIPWPAVGHGRAGSGVVGHFAAQETADHAASWHPAVALAVSHWLADVAADLDADLWPDGHDVPRNALAVATAYLKESQ